MTAPTLEFIIYAIFVHITAYFLISKFSKAIALFVALGAALCLILGMTNIELAFEYLTWNLVITIATSIMTHGLEEFGRRGLGTFAKFR